MNSTTTCPSIIHPLFPFLSSPLLPSSINLHAPIMYLYSLDRNELDVVFVVQFPLFLFSLLWFFQSYSSFLLNSWIEESFNQLKKTYSLQNLFILVVILSLLISISNIFFLLIHSIQIPSMSKDSISTIIMVVMDSMIKYIISSPIRFTRAGGVLIAHYNPSIHGIYWMDTNQHYPPLLFLLIMKYSF